MLLDKKSVLVLDGGDGIGGAIVALFRAEGARVSSTVLPDTDVASAFEKAHAAMGGVDVLVNAISDWSPCKPEDWSVGRWRELSELNGAVAVSAGHIALKRLRRPGAVCFISSTWALATSPEMGLTGASKAAIGPLTKALGLFGAAYGLRANAVVMGLIDTPALRAAMEQRAQLTERHAGGSTLFDETAGRVPMRRAGTADEVAKAVAFLCSDHARMINGASVLVDGGLLYA
ncbi:MAG: SDR family NAD(P)-dependent oxidoreductase [Immundisolibacter sp.]|uniref:SDR family NAD(P)-dependent oxidoreductase n=1 Tax=Immundisolibacter sp. TaxID=1934948 RepID=UPI003EE008BD